MKKFESSNTPDNFLNFLCHHEECKFLGHRMLLTRNLRNQLQNTRQIIVFFQEQGIQSIGELTHRDFEKTYQCFRQDHPSIASTARRLQQFLDEKGELPPPVPTTKTRLDKELENFAELFPNDPTLYLKLIDYYILIGNHRKTQENIDKLLYETEDDFLNLLKAKAFLDSSEYDKAEDHFAYMTQNYPYLIEGYIGYICTLTYQYKFEEALKVTDDLIEQGYDKKELTDFFEEKDEQGQNELQLLVDSKVYKKWKRKS